MCGVLVRLDCPSRESWIGLHRNLTYEATLGVSTCNLKIYTTLFKLFKRHGSYITFTLKNSLNYKKCFKTFQVVTIRVALCVRFLFFLLLLLFFFMSVGSNSVLLCWAVGLYGHCAHAAWLSGLSGWIGPNKSHRVGWGNMGQRGRMGRVFSLDVIGEIEFFEFLSSRIYCS